MQEYILGEEPGEEAKPWHDHDWSAQEVTFVSSYLRTGNAGMAYREAFQVDKDRDPGAWLKASVAGRRLLARDYMRSYVDECQAILRERMKMDKQSILEELAKMGMANMSDFVVLQDDGAPQFDLSGLTRDQFAAVSELTIDTYYEGKGQDAREVRSVKVKLAPKIGPLELLGKHHKMWTDVVASSADIDVVEEINRARRERAERRKELENEPGQDDDVRARLGEPDRSDAREHDDDATPGRAGRDASDAGADGADAD